MIGVVVLGFAVLGGILCWLCWKIGGLPYIVPDGDYPSENGDGEDGP